MTAVEFRIEPFKPEHLAMLALQPHQQPMRAFMQTPGYAEMLAETDAFTVYIDGRIVMCAGVMTLWEGRGTAWALLTGDLGGEHMRRVHYAAKRYFDASTLRRIEATCDVDFEEGHRWLRLLGFTLETPVMRNYRPDGGDESMYVRVR
jgi:hypothetical protein